MSSDLQQIAVQLKVQYFSPPLDACLRCADHNVLHTTKRDKGEAFKAPPLPLCRIFGCPRALNTAGTRVSRSFPNPLSRGLRATEMVRAAKLSRLLVCSSPRAVL